MSKSGSMYDVRDIFGDRETIQNPKGSAGTTAKREGVTHTVLKPWYPQHKEDNIDRIVKQYGQGTGYAKWQNEKYPVKVDISLLRARMIGKIDKGGFVK